MRFFIPLHSRKKPQMKPGSVTGDWPAETKCIQCVFLWKRVTRTGVCVDICMCVHPRAEAQSLLILPQHRGLSSGYH